LYNAQKITKLKDFFIPKIDREKRLLEVIDAPVMYSDGVWSKLCSIGRLRFILRRVAGYSIKCFENNERHDELFKIISRKISTLEDNKSPFMFSAKQFFLKQIALKKGPTYAQDLYSLQR